MFLESVPSDQVAMLQVLAPGERVLWMRLLPLDDAADLVQAAPEEERTALLALLDDAARREVTALMAYSEDVAGGLMNPRFLRLRPELTVEETISYLRKQRPDIRLPIHYGYVLDETQRLLGVVPLLTLFSSPAERTARDVMTTDPIVVADDTDQELVGRLFREHGLFAVPVLDSAGRMKGIVTVDDIVDVLDEEATEDMQKVGGVAALDAPYLKATFKTMLGRRGGWLTILFLGEMLTATAMGWYEEQLATAIVLALFVPLIISSGGNAGSQATTLVIRAMALGEVTTRDWWNVIRREFAVGLALGLLLAVIGALRILLWHALFGSYGPHYAFIAMTVSLSLTGVVLWGTLAGSTLPFILRLFKLDPASASAPFVATLVDVTGLIIYFTVAGIVLRGTLL
ncbi:MAG TPA: magnesium transporter [Vicinamibacterales bacterium]|nr:magnesium transporter [Vicinamibacterales bacterium]